ncbi:D-glycero-alpha-D-manno-heptose-1,7-bisphosphate 7-phosphatase [Planctomycetota bacterium]
MSNKAIFLDRDNTLINDPGYINHPDQVELLDGVAEALNELKNLGFKLIVVTNQSAVARGIVTEKVLGKIHDRMEELLAEQNAELDRIYYCPYHPDGVVPEFSKESDSRKPAPGMLLKAADEMDLDLNQSWCIGDSAWDVEAGRQAGCKTILIDKPSPHQKPSHKTLSFEDVGADYKAINTKEAVNIIKKYLRSSGSEEKQTEPATANPEEPDSTVDEPTSQTEEQSPQSEIQEPQAPPDRTEELLKSILGQLKSMQRDDMFSEFSVMRLMAGMVQVVVLFCLLVTLWFLMSPAREDNSVFIALGFAIVFQLMALTFYLMQGKK